MRNCSKKGEVSKVARKIRTDLVFIADSCEVDCHVFTIPG
jgi:hypothetical protein